MRATRWYDTRRQPRAAGARERLPGRPLLEPVERGVHRLPAAQHATGTCSPSPATSPSSTWSGHGVLSMTVPGYGRVILERGRDQGRPTATSSSTRPARPTSATTSTATPRSVGDALRGARRWLTTRSQRRRSRPTGGRRRRSLKADPSVPAAARPTPGGPRPSPGRGCGSPPTPDPGHHDAADDETRHDERDDTHGSVSPRRGGRSARLRRPRGVEERDEVCHPADGFGPELLADARAPARTCPVAPRSGSVRRSAPAGCRGPPSAAIAGWRPVRAVRPGDPPPTRARRAAMSATSRIEPSAIDTTRSKASSTGARRSRSFSR